MKLMGMIKRCALIFSAAAILLLSGCATVHEMALKKGDQSLALKGKGMVLMSMEISNHYKPDYQPQIIVAQVEKPNAKEKKDRDNFKTDMDGTVASSNGSRYLLRMELNPGHYIIRGAMCRYQSLFIMATCQMPVHGEIEVKANEISYLGRAEGVLRERHGDEFRAGPVIPLIDQGVAGFSGGTFDVSISDQQQEDLEAYRQLFPALRNQRIEVSILPPFDRERAQIWWDSNGNKDKPTAEVVHAKADQ
ncbi:MAG TPA: hypothetical protein VKA31_09895 [Mariprofundaceae bacterium]|nr:hypothetical protein [Mariprofundaceae bacterium]